MTDNEIEKIADHLLESGVIVPLDREDCPYVTTEEQAEKALKGSVENE